jgi:ureidoacrylate peracid hydrolase
MVTFAIDPRKSAVVAVDLQNCNVEKSPIAAPLGLRVVDKLNLLAAHYRGAGSTIIWTRHAVIWTRHAVRPDHSDVGILGETVPPVAQGVIDDGASSAALHPKVVVQAGDIILAKPHFGSFQATELETSLRARRIDTVLIGGIATNFCCDTTAREAHAREFKVLFLSDGTATIDLRNTAGGTIPADRVQGLTLATLAFGFAEVLRVAEACEKLSATRARATA